jgi:hypothetical protein
MMARRDGIFDRIDAVLDPHRRRSRPGPGFAVAGAALILGAVLALAVLGGCNLHRQACHATSWVFHDTEEVLEAEIRGEVTFDDGETAIRSMGRGAYFALYTKRGPGSVRIEVEPDIGGSPVFTYRVAGRSRPFDQAAAVWFADRLPEALRELAVNVEPRIRRIYDSEGEEGVLAEVERLRSDMAKRKNLDAYFALTGLTQDEAARGLVSAGASVHSPYELSRLLEGIAQLAAGDEPVRRAYFAAVDQIWSPRERVRLLSVILDKWMDDEQVFRDAVTALKRVNSGHEIACLLDSIECDTDQSRLRHALADSSDA